MAGASRKTNWEDTGIIPTTDLVGWYQCKHGVATAGLAPDFSGGDRHMVQAANGPTIIENVLNGQPAWYFNGTNNPLIYAGAVPASQHVIILAAAEGAAFSINRGLFSGITAGDWLTSDSAGTKFFNFGPDYAYRKSGVDHADADMQAPMNLAAELIEATYATPLYLFDGWQLGQQRDLDSGARRWKGYVFEILVYSTIQTGRNLDRIYLYHNIKFAQQRKGLPFYFPSDNIILPRRKRFYAEPPMWEKVVDSFEYEDGGKDFNEVSDNAPRRWEYEYHLVNRIANTDPPENAIFDEFYNQARRSTPFILRDKHGVEWSNVRVEAYRRTHREHKPWDVDISFKLIGNTSVPTYPDVAVPDNSNGLAYLGEQIGFNGEGLAFTP